MISFIIFAFFVGGLFWLSWFLGRRNSSESGFFVAGGQIHWFVNGIALTGGYLSAASFLGICGMISFSGFDGFLYSIGFLSGWVVALFVVAEPLRRLGKYTFADALESRFNSRKIHLAAGISTLVICICYLVPQMVGAGVLIEPLLGLPHHWGVILVGGVVIMIVASAGMSSTTYVQFIKAGMLITFSLVLVIAILVRGFDTEPEQVNIYGQNKPATGTRTLLLDADKTWPERLKKTPYTFTAELPDPAEPAVRWIRLDDQQPEKTAPKQSWWRMTRSGTDKLTLQRAQFIINKPDGTRIINGDEKGSLAQLAAMGRILRFGTNSAHSGRREPVGFFKMLRLFADPETLVELPRKTTLRYKGQSITLIYGKRVAGNELMRPGGHFKIGKESPWGRVNFISLMIALFFGTAALPHVLIRYYTVKDSTAARKSTITAISAIGLFYILTLFLGLGAIGNGVLNPLSDNMSAPLLARSFGNLLFAIISALAFATVLGTVSGLIVAASGAVANDLMDKFFKRNMEGRKKVIAAKTTAVTVGILAVILGIVFKGLNVGFLVGLAFAVAASANFPAIIMVLFWKKTTPQGIVASILTGTAVSLGLILMGPELFQLYGYSKADAWVPLGQPAIIAMPLSFLTLIAVSLFTGKKTAPAE